MDVSNLSSSISNTYGINSYNASYSSDQLVINATLIDDQATDQQGFGINDLTKSLTISAEEILSKINEQLKDKLPDGIESLDPSKSTPDATATRIVQGATALFDTYAKQHPEMSSEEVLTHYLDLVRSGVEDGYGQAYDTLDQLGAFNFDGVKAGIEETKTLIESKLQAFEQYKRQELGLTNDGTAGILPASS